MISRNRSGPHHRGDVHRPHHIGEQHRHLLELRSTGSTFHRPGTPMTEPGTNQQPDPTNGTPQPPTSDLPPTNHWSNPVECGPYARNLAANGA